MQPIDGELIFNHLALKKFTYFQFIEDKVTAEERDNRVRRELLMSIKSGFINLVA